jgi:hypothetical protein
MGSTPPKAVLLLSEALWDGPRPSSRVCQYYGTPARRPSEASSRLQPRPLEEHQAVGSGRDTRFEEDEISGYALIGERGVLHAAAFAG